MTEERSCLSSDALLRHMKAGRIFILPFNRRNLGTSQYDVRLGSFYFREERESKEPRVFDIFEKESVDRVWGRSWHEAMRHADWARIQNGEKLLGGIGPEERIIVLEPGETILAHTLEFIGGNDNRITTKMQARSSLGRCFIAVCKCAGMGDIGYRNRWTMEIANSSRSQRIPLVTGMRIAQISFFETEGVSGPLYQKGGKYQDDITLAEMVRGWHPESMKPRLYRDWELKEGYGYRSFTRAYNEEVEKFLEEGFPAVEENL